MSVARKSNVPVEKLHCRNALCVVARMFHKGWLVHAATIEAATLPRYRRSQARGLKQCVSARPSPQPLLRKVLYEHLLRPRMLLAACLFRPQNISYRSRHQEERSRGVMQI